MNQFAIGYKNKKVRAIDFGKSDTVILMNILQ